ncbi:hypothetical protein JFQ74_004073 [Vibrio parahaemolyticus]|uniref:hypothetical protein n=1 Tax=Vibrio parahaemolyticus TaxID=670 RepID=UPI0011210998|nr:hypothetical protein [Vibrio parahaemolyticus]EGU0168194.1 hypothetical protein [Vibrio parahaemolyticus]TOI93717.1 hypothetical protein CGI54_01475 [Vibrio parahaemolyticus]HBC3358705.1 hypothetical protein [Vibrio parahaemolyticus]HBC3870160.1 hypothetical protein [Vibrio parahaemolyticus]
MYKNKVLAVLLIGFSFQAFGKISTEEKIANCENYAETAKQIMKDLSMGTSEEKLNDLYVTKNPDYLDGLRNGNFIKEAISFKASNQELDNVSKEFSAHIYADCYEYATGKRSKL